MFFPAASAKRENEVQCSSLRQRDPRRQIDNPQVTGKVHSNTWRRRTGFVLKFSMLLPKRQAVPAVQRETSKKRGRAHGHVSRVSVIHQEISMSLCLRSNTDILLKFIVETQEDGKESIFSSFLAVETFW